MIHFAETKYGFDYGSAKITRLHSDEKRGQVWISLETPKMEFDLYITKTGKVRIFEQDKGEWGLNKH